MTDEPTEFPRNDAERAGLDVKESIQRAHRSRPVEQLADPTAQDTDVLTRNNVRVFGRGTQPMVFAHGFGCDQNMWRFITPAFEDDYRLVLFDYVGSGRSDLSA